ncbi:sigma-54-dependent Fis family transcriptional regulator [Pseudonocardia sp. ICBG1293]|uniref:sigma-54-dependent Fis family transcriptional regulator n=1 Tax=Pseudonocardia sp. ICBG1293 TaxID=2844382 RepID=UPI001CCB43FC|nr:helix-turn-helix domain-containing protein [Pseudonocardia sp. ICBG1293]
MTRRDDDTAVPALSAGQRRHIRRSRETLVDGGLLAVPPGHAGVPPLIEQSWRRCIGEAVPTAPERIGHADPGDDHTLLRRAAEPVLARLVDSFADVPVAMVLSDATGRIVRRHVGPRRQRTIMDRASAVEGSDFSERSVGTNGIGTVLVERRPVLVRGPEHYNALLENLTCAGTPVVDPGTGRAVGSFSLACAVGDVHPLMAVMAADIGRQIEGRLLDEAVERHRRLVRAYLALGRTTAGALVVDADTLLGDRPALAHAGPDLHPLLWAFLREDRPDRARRMRVPLPDGLHDAVVAPVEGTGGTAFSIRLGRRSPPVTEPARAAVRGATGQHVRSRPEARHDARRHRGLHHDPEADRRLRDAVAHRETVAVTGPGGSGKLRTARLLLSRLGLDDVVVVEPHRDPDWFTTARAAAAAGRGLVLRRVHAAPGPSAAELRDLAATGGPIALTAEATTVDGRLSDLLGQVATVVRLPALAAGREHLPALVEAVLAGLPGPASGSRPTAAALDRLLAWHWPGDIAELHTVLGAAARRAAGGPIGPTDLPDRLRAARRGLALMEAAERDAVVEALRGAGGNRTRAARALGIGRNTLYRKLREFGIS